MKITIEQALQRGVAAHKEGRLQDAESLYRTVLQSQPLHPDANHNLGLIAVSANQPSAALPLLKTAVDANPNIEQFWLTYIDALVRADQKEKAKKTVKKAVRRGFDAKKLDLLLAKTKFKASGKEPSKEQINKLLELYQNRRFIDTEKLALAITQDFPENVFAWKVLGAALGGTGRKAEAVDATQRAVALSPKDVEAHSNLGVMLQELGRLNEAVASYTRAIKLKPDFAQAHNNLGIALKELGKLDEARACYKKAIALKPDYPEAFSNLGNTLQELGLLNEAETSYKKAITLRPNYAEAYGNLGNTLRELGRLDEAVESYNQAVTLNPSYAEAHNNLGITLKESGRAEDAKTSFGKAITLKPDYAEAYNNLGITLKETGRVEEAEKSFSKAITLKPDYAEAHNNLGITKKETGRVEEAEKSFNTAITLKPDYAEAHFNLGNVMKGLGRVTQAEESFRRAITLKPDYAEAHTNLGTSLKELGRLDDAVASYTQAVTLRPDYPEAHNNLGATFRELERMDEAEASFRQAIALKPDYALAHYGLSRILYIKDNKDLALENIAKANRIEPKKKEYELILRVMEARNIYRDDETELDNSRKTNLSAESALCPIILSRAVEAELISCLYEMDSVQLDRTKRAGLLASGKNDARYGNGLASPDFSLFDDSHAAIQKLANDLKKLITGSLNSDIYIYDSFFNILGAGGGTTPHSHINEVDKDAKLDLGKQKYSLVYYLAVGDQRCNEPGILKLYEPSEDILPCEGMIVIIPASRMHSAVYGGKTDRVMVGVNFYTF